jgi:FAD/FMN-containing dehydrogenase/Fe-S oxidoreductase
VSLIQIENDALRLELEGTLEGEVRFDALSRALYSTDASVYQMEPRGVVVVRSREDLIAAVTIAARHGCSVTLRGGGTSQAGQAIGEGLQIDTSKYFNRILELNAAERWVRVQPGIVLDELNTYLRPHGLRFAPDVSTASRATIGGMISNNSSGARSVIYGKTIDHVIELEMLLADGSVSTFRDLSSDELAGAMTGDSFTAECYRAVARISAECEEEIDRRFPKVLRRVGGYNLDDFVPAKLARNPFNLAKMIVGSEGTLGVVLEAKLNLVPLPKVKAVLTVQFRDLLEALGATPHILKHGPSAVEVMDSFILSHTKLSANLQRMRETFVEGEPGALLCIEFYDDDAAAVERRVIDLEEDLKQHGFGYRWYRALDAAAQARVWSLRESALGLSMTMKEDAKSISFVEDTAVAPEKLRDYIERFLAIIASHGTTAGVYAHASVGCLHVRPVVNMKTAEGVAKFEAIASDIADLVLEFGGALSGEHGDGMVRSPFMRRMYGDTLYEAFRAIKRTFDPRGIFNPGKIVDSPPLAANLRFGAGYRTPNPRTFFDYSEFGGLGGAVEMCSGLGACRKTLEGTMCPSYMATREETHTTRGRANALRLAMTGKLREAGLDDESTYAALDLCLECRACKAECPVGVDMARFKSEFLAGYWETHGTPLSAKFLGNVHGFARAASPLAGLVNLTSDWPWVRQINETLFGIDRRRNLPKLAEKSRRKQLFDKGSSDPEVLIFDDTFTKYFDPEIGVAAREVIASGGLRVGPAPNVCCGRPLISKGLLAQAQEQARRNTQALYDSAAAGKKIVFCEPSCLSAVREDAPSLLRGEEQRKARVVAEACLLFEQFVADSALEFRPGPRKILLHGHCHQKSMGLLPAAKSALSKIPGATVVDLEAGCCGMAGSFGYSRDHYEVSRAIGERRLLPQVRAKAADDVVVAAGTSCRHQIADFTPHAAVHPAVLLASLVVSRR